MNTETEAEIIQEQQSMAVARPQPAEAKPALTHTQARIEAVADLTRVAMSKAGTLQLTPEESKALAADFGDECFQPGAGGKENLIYIEHAALRDRFSQVLGLGQWAIIVRETWNEDFTTRGNQKGVRVYCRAMLLIRGVYVAESVGDMDYYPGNAAQNYGDAFEGSKSAAFRRCAKEFGVGLQAWRKEWTAGWWERRRGGTNLRQPAPSQPRPAASTADVTGNGHTHDQKERFVKLLVDNLPASRKVGDEYGWGEFTVEKLNWGKVPKLTKQWVDWLHNEFQRATADQKREGETQGTAQTESAKPGSAPLDEKNPDWFWDCVVVVPRRGMKKAEYMKAPDTIRSLYDAMKGGDEDAKTRLWGLAKEWDPKPYDWNGKTYQPTEADHQCRRALDALCDREGESNF